MKLLDPEALKSGTDTQRRAFTAISDLKLFEKLKAYSPVLAGTFPIDLDVESSDVDVVCSSEDLEAFIETLRTHFKDEQNFHVELKAINGRPTVLCRFRSQNVPFEIFAQDASVFTQSSVVHMLVEARILAFAPPEAKAEIRALKRQGLKTEPAFAKTFEIEGDPYSELLQMSRWTDREILDLTHRFRFRPG